MHCVLSDVFFCLGLSQVISEWWSSTWNPRRRGRNLPLWILFSTTAVSISRKCLGLCGRAPGTDWWDGVRLGEREFSALWVLMLQEERAEGSSVQWCLQWTTSSFCLCKLGWWPEHPQLVWVYGNMYHQNRTSRKNRALGLAKLWKKKWVYCTAECRINPCDQKRQVSCYSWKQLRGVAWWGKRRSLYFPATVPASQACWRGSWKVTATWDGTCHMSWGVYPRIS